MLLVAALLLAAGVAGAAPINERTCGVEPPHNLMVFVGKQISIREVPATAGTLVFDSEYRTRFQVLQWVCGAQPVKELEFTSFDHYGLPAYTEHKTVLMYVSKEDGRLVQQKYLFQPVYETANGSWAGCGDPYADEPPVHRHSLRAVPISFKRPVSFTIDKKLSAKELRERFPAEHYRRRGDNTMECIAGSPLADLFEVKRAGVLKARELFK